MLTLADLKQHAVVEHDEDDALLQRKLDAASAWCMSYVGATNADGPVFDEAILQLATAWYRNREAVSFGATGMEVPFGVTDLLNSIRDWYR